MLKLNDILKYLKVKDTEFAHYYIGKLNDKNDNSLGIYNMNINRVRQIAIGGLDNTKSKNKYISLLVHGNKNKTQTEQLAYNLYEHLLVSRGDQLGQYEIDYIRLLCDEPIDVGTDKNGTYEYVIELQLFYRIK